MTRACKLIPAILATTVALPAHATDHPANIDLTTYTCGQFMRSIQDDPANEVLKLALWLDGYLASISGDTHIHWDNVKEFSADLTDYCRRNSNSTLMDAARNAGIL